VTALKIKLVIKQRIKPIIVGKIAATNVHLIEPVSFFIVITVVAHGQWNSEKRITFRAVIIVHPLFIKISLKKARLPISIREPEKV